MKSAKTKISLVHKLEIWTSWRKYQKNDFSLKILENLNTFSETWPFEPGKQQFEVIRHIFFNHTFSLKLFIENLLISTQKSLSSLNNNDKNFFRIFFSTVYYILKQILMDPESFGKKKTYCHPFAGCQPCCHPWDQPCGWTTIFFDISCLWASGLRWTAPFSARLYWEWTPPVWWSLTA